MFSNLVLVESHQIIHSIYREIGINFFFKIFEVSQIQTRKSPLQINDDYRLSVSRINQLVW
jgi:hypothetical protein